MDKRPHNLTITTLGGLHIARGDQQVTGLASRKAEALLVYLACDPRPHPREVLADLFWDGRTQRRAMANLRVVLSSLNKQLGEYVDIERDTAALNAAAQYRLDVAELEQALAAPEWDLAAAEASLQHYRGEFLEGFYLREASGFEAWQFREQERIHRLVIDGLQRLVEWDLRQGQYKSGISHASRLLALDPLQETAHRQLMTLLALSGQREQALAQFETCRQLLFEELGIEPSAVTAAVYEAILADQLERILLTKPSVTTIPTSPLPGLVVADRSTEPSQPAMVETLTHRGEEGSGEQPGSGVGMLEVTLLGQFKVLHDGEPLTIPSRNAQSLFAYLLLSAGQFHRREKLAGLLWPDSDEENARSYLRHELWRLRKVLEIGEQSYFLVDNLTIAFDPASDHSLDVHTLERIALEGSTADELAAALSVYRGELLPGFYDDWVSLERERLQALFEARMARLVDLLQSEGRWVELQDWAARWIALGHWPEAAYRGLMSAYANLGDVSQAVATYERLAQGMYQDLGVEPSALTTAAYEAIVAGQLGRPVPERSSVAPIQAAPLPDFLAGDRATEPSQLAFVARQDELSWLSEQLTKALSNGVRVVFVAGEAGSGKTTLLNEFVRQAQAEHETLLAAWGNSHTRAGRGDPYVPFRELFLMLAGDVETSWTTGATNTEQARRLWQSLPVTARILFEKGPALLDVFVPARSLVARVKAVDGDSPWFRELQSRAERLDPSGELESERLFEQVAMMLQALAKQWPIVLVLDDLHLIDQASTDLLFYLSRRLAGSAILIVGAYRAEEVARGRRGRRHPLVAVINACKRAFGDTILDLDEADGRDFVKQLLDSQLNSLTDEFRESLWSHTEGQPLFTVELLRDMQERGDLIRDAQGRWMAGQALAWDKLPARIEGVIDERIGRLDEDLASILSVAAVEGEQFTAQVVALVRDVPQLELVHQLSHHLEREHRLVIEQRGHQMAGRRLYRYRFWHRLFQQHIYQKLGQMERALLHMEVGQALESLHAADLPTYYGELAYHAEQAGEPDKAAGWYLKAAERARRQGAMLEAQDYFHCAIDNMPAANTLQRWPAVVGHYRASEILSDTKAAEEDVAELLRLAEEMDDPKLSAEARLHQASHAQWMGDDHSALEAFEQALEAARTSGDEHLETQLLGMMISSLARLGEMAAAVQVGESALAKAEALGDEDLLSRSLNNLATCYLQAGNYSQAAMLLERHVAISRSQGNMALEALGLLNLAYNQLQLGQWALAEETAGQSLAIADSLGAPRWQAYNHLHLCLVHLRQGNTSQAQKDLEAAQPIWSHIDDAFGAAIGHSYLGLVLEAAGQLQAAIAAFDQARQRLEAMGTAGFAADALAGLARCAMASDDLKQAQQQATELWGYLAENGASSLEFPIWAFLTCAQVFAAVGDSTMARKIAQAGYEELMTRARRIDDNERRRAYLEQLAEHRSILTMLEGENMNRRNLKEV